MRRVQKFGAAVVFAAMLASGITIFSEPVYASGGGPPSRTAICNAIERIETQLSTSDNPFVKKYLSALLNALQKLEDFVGGCQGS